MKIEPQLLVALLLAREQPGDPLQALDGPMLQPVLLENLGLQDQVFQDIAFRFTVGTLPSLLRRCFGRSHWSCSVGSLLEAGGNRLVTMRVQLPAQPLQALAVPGIVGVHVHQAVQGVSRLDVLFGIRVQVKELALCGAEQGVVVQLVVQVSQKLQHLDARQALLLQSLHGGDEVAVLLGCEHGLLQFAQKFGGLLTVPPAQIALRYPLQVLVGVRELRSDAPKQLLGAG